MGKLEQELVGQGLTAEVFLECSSIDQSLAQHGKVVNLSVPETNRNQRRTPEYTRASIRKKTPIERVPVLFQALESGTRTNPFPELVPQLQTREALVIFVSMLQLDRLQSPATSQGVEHRLVPIVKRRGPLAEETKRQVLQVASRRQSIADEGNVAD